MSSIEEHVKYGLDILPTKPSYMAYSILEKDLTNAIQKVVNEVVGSDISHLCHQDLHEQDAQYFFIIDAWEAEDQLSAKDFDKLVDFVGYDLEEYYDYTNHLAKIALGIPESYGSWVHVQGYHESSQVDIQVGVRSL